MQRYRVKLGGNVDEAMSELELVAENEDQAIEMASKMGHRVVSIVAIEAAAPRRSGGADRSKSEAAAGAELDVDRAVQQRQDVNEGRMVVFVAAAARAIAWFGLIGYLVVGLSMRNPDEIGGGMGVVLILFQAASHWVIFMAIAIGLPMLRDSSDVV